MKALLFKGTKGKLSLSDFPEPCPESRHILLRVEACGVCRTDLHIVDCELSVCKLPIIPGHQIVGKVEMTGKEVSRFKKGDRVGVSWLGWTCGQCYYCRYGNENLCDSAKFTGYHIDGGFAEYCIAHEDYCFFIPSEYTPVEAAPLLCGGLIGFRAYSMLGEAEKIGFYGFGSAAHLIAQVAIFQKRIIYAFVKPGDIDGINFAKEIGVYWAGTSDEFPEEKLDAVIVFAPAGEIIPRALNIIRKGGVVICAGIHMSDIPSFPYSILSGEKTLKSVANLTRKDGEAFLSIASYIPVKPVVTEYKLSEGEKALNDLRSGRLKGSAVLLP